MRAKLSKAEVVKLRKLSAKIDDMWKTFDDDNDVPLKYSNVSVSSHLRMASSAIWSILQEYQEV